MNEIPSVIRRYVEGLKSHDVLKIENTLADGVMIVLATRILKKPAFLEFLTALYHAFPDWHYESDEPQVAAEGAIAIQWRQGGTHTMPWKKSGMSEIPATGKSIGIPTQRFCYKLADGKIVEIRPDPIPGGMPEAVLDQLGVS